MFMKSRVSLNCFVSYEVMFFCGIVCGALRRRNILYSCFISLVL